MDLILKNLIKLYCSSHYYNYIIVACEIKAFTPKSNIEYYILFFANIIDNLVIYPREKTTYIDLLWLRNFAKPKSTQNTINLVYCKGTANYLKITVKFIETLSNSFILWDSKEIKTVNVTGNRIFIQLDNRLAIYIECYKDTVNMTNIVSKIPGNNYKFYCDIINFNNCLKY